MLTLQLTEETSIDVVYRLLIEFNSIKIVVDEHYQPLSAILNHYQSIYIYNIT